jgi:hypothetical protein
MNKCWNTKFYNTILHIIIQAKYREAQQKKSFHMVT